MAQLLSGILDKIDSLAKDALGANDSQEESATAIRSRRKATKIMDDDSLDESPRPGSGTAIATPILTLEGTPRHSSSAESSLLHESPRIHRGLDDTVGTEVDGHGYSSASGVSPTPLSGSRQSTAHDGVNDPWTLLQQNRRELENVNRECLELEERCKGLQEEVLGAWKTYKTAQEKAALREGELRDEINLLKRAKDTDRTQMIVVMEEQGKEATELQDRLQELVQNEERLQSLVYSIELELNSSKKEKEDLIRELANIRVSQGLSVDSIREELRRAEQQTAELKTQHATWLRHSQKRETELEQANAELSETLAAQMRKLEELNLHAKSSALDITVEEHASLTRELQDTQTALAISTQQKQAIVERVSLLEQELRTCKERREEERRALVEENQTLRSEGYSLQQAIEELRSSQLRGPENHSLAELETKVSSLTEQLLKKQSQVHSLQTEKAALKSKAHDLQERLQNMERLLESTRDLEGEGYDGVTHLHGEGLPRRRTGRRTQTLGTALQPMGVNSHVAKAVDAIDAWSLVAGSFMRANPLVRFAFVLYLCVLHLWVFVVLSLHTHSLDSPEPNISTNADGKSVSFS